MSAVRDLVKRERDLRTAERIFAECFRAALTMPGATKETVLPYLVGRLNLGDELFAQWQALPSSPGCRS